MNTMEHEQLVEEIMSIFDMLGTEDSIEEGGFGSEREMAEGDLKRLTTKELKSSLEHTERFLATMWKLAADVIEDPVAMTVVGDSQRRVEAALRRCC
jgi:hypothetical protein